MVQICFLFVSNRPRCSVCLLRLRDCVGIFPDSGDEVPGPDSTDAAEEALMPVEQQLQLRNALVVGPRLPEVSQGVGLFGMVWVWLRSAETPAGELMTGGRERGPDYL